MTAMSRLQTVKLLLWGFLGLGLAVVAHRMVYGLGATTNLNDAVPWGLWKGFGVIAGIALAAGGFVVTGVIHVFHLHRYHALVRPAVITALMGYGSAATTLLFDIGLPWRIWHPVIYWQIESPLFEVAWCVMLYLTVLTLEFTPIVIEGWPRLSKLAAFMKKFSLPLVILGVMISTLHQSTLGTIFLITPFSLHPLWYSPIQYLLFIVSAAGLGTMVIVTEFIVVPWLYHRPIDLARLAPVARVASFALWAYLILRLGDLIVRGQISHVADGSWESTVFILELLFSTILPCSLLASRRIRSSAAGLIGCAALIMLGFIFQRVAVSGLAMLSASGGNYFPSWSEFALSGGILSAAGLFFLFAVERFAIWSPPLVDRQPTPDLPPQDSVGLGWVSEMPTALSRRGSLGFVFGAALALGLLPFRSARSEGLESVPTYAARGEPASVLRIDGNRDGFLVEFDHAKHVEANGGEKDSCKRCHHMHEPYDKNTGCYRCHTDMYLARSIFSHDYHVNMLGWNDSCQECHELGKGRSRESAKACDQCHVDALSLKVPDATIASDGDLAPSYTDAMHGLCIGCHDQVADQINKPHHAVCSTCHPLEYDPERHDEWEKRQTLYAGKWVLTGTPATLKPSTSRSSSQRSATSATSSPR
jgi:Ni/Fe-hydrogenase subunit HybB-like protein